jgi:hypothetical protein
MVYKLLQRIGLNSGNAQNNMDALENPIPEIQKVKHDDTLMYHPYALKRMIERQIQVDQLIEALNSTEVEVIENYPQIGRSSPECLILGRCGGGKYLHMLVKYPVYEIVTTYEPTLPKFKNPRERANR